MRHLPLETVLLSVVNTECHDAECHYVECRSAMIIALVNTLDYRDTVSIVAVNYFIVQGLGAYFIKLLCRQFKNFHNKLECFSLASFFSLF
jgi:hypothetical protein